MWLTKHGRDLTSFVVSFLLTSLFSTVLILNECEGQDKAAALNLTPEETEDYNYLKKKWEENLSSQEKALELLKLFPVLDSHNDFPWSIRKLVLDDLEKFNFTDLSNVEPWASFNMSHTDLKRLRAGHVGFQFWVSFMVCANGGTGAVSLYLEQFDVIFRLIDTYSDNLEFCDTAACITESRKTGKIASLIGIEGGHAIASSPGVLRQMYRLGARYMTLTHRCRTEWAHASPDDMKVGGEKEGLSSFGEQLIEEMNRMGMMVDLSHVAKQTMLDAIGRSKAPVIFSHSNARALCDHHRNVPDDVLQLMKKNGGIIMMNFYSNFLQCDPAKTATLDDLIAHMEHIRGLLGSTSNMGLGADFDGVDKMAEGLEDVSKYPVVFAKLIDHGWELEDLIGVAFKNFVRVMSQVEKVSKELQSQTNYHVLQRIIPSQDS